VVTGVNSFGETVTDTDSAQVIVPILYLPWIVKQEAPIPCPPPNGCPLANEIKAMAVNQTTNRLYVVARNPDELLLVNPVTNQILARKATGAQPWGIAVDEQTNRVYVADFAGADVRIYDGTTLDVLATIQVGDNPTLAQLLPGTNTVFVLVRGGSRVAIIDGLTMVQEINTGGTAPFGIAADGVNQRIFISHRESANLTMLRKVNGAWQAFAGPQLSDNRQFFELEYSPSNNRLFALWADPNSNWFMDVWEPKDNDIWGHFSTQPMPSGGNLNDPNVGGAAMDLNATTGNLFNVNTGVDSLSVIDVVTLGIVGTVNLGDDPFSVAVDDVRNQVYVGLRASGHLIKLTDNY
jgi:YVTN family beta-propeller protein